MLTVDILRHGALEGGVKYRGHVDDPLTAAGRSQMDEVWQQLHDSIDLIVTSPLGRCAVPAKAWSEERAVNCIIEPRVAELYYGDWEGKTVPEIQTHDAALLDAWRNDPTGLRPPGGESPEELLARLTDWWQEMICSHVGKHLLLVTHSGAMRMLIAYIQGTGIAGSRQMAMPYGCWSRVCHEHGRDNLIFHNRQIVTGNTEATAVN